MTHDQDVTVLSVPGGLALEAAARLLTRASQEPEPVRLWLRVWLLLGAGPVRCSDLAGLEPEDQAAVLALATAAVSGRGR